LITYATITQSTPIAKRSA